MYGDLRQIPCTIDSSYQGLFPVILGHEGGGIVSNHVPSTASHLIPVRWNRLAKALQVLLPYVNTPDSTLISGE